MAIVRSVKIRGEVQGVFFRAWTRDQALRIGVAGWVRNCADDSVEAHLEGEEGAVSELISHLREGPSGARVASVQVSDGVAEQLAGFEVRR